MIIENQTLKDQIFNLIKKNGDSVTTKDIALKLDTNENVVRVNVNRLQNEGKIFEVGKQGQYKLYGITEILKIKPETMKSLELYMDLLDIKEVNDFIQELLDCWVRHEFMAGIDLDKPGRMDDEGYYLYLLGKQSEIFKQIDDVETKEEKKKIIIQARAINELAERISKRLLEEE